MSKFGMPFTIGDERRKLERVAAVAAEA